MGCGFPPAAVLDRTVISAITASCILILPSAPHFFTPQPDFPAPYLSDAGGAAVPISVASWHPMQWDWVAQADGKWEAVSQS